MHRLVLIVGIIGVTLFGSIFALSYANPLAIERGARKIVRLEIERRVGEKIDKLTSSRIAALAERAFAKTDIDVDDARRVLRNDVPAKIVGVVANMLDANCECRQRLAGYLQASANERLASLVQLRTRLSGLLESMYAHVSAKLMREFRIFTGANAIAIVGGVVIAGSLYLFKQDWLHTIVFNDYVGFAYAAWLAGVALLLADILMNRARVTTRIVNVALDAAGSAVTAVPC